MTQFREISLLILLWLIIGTLSADRAGFNDALLKSTPWPQGAIFQKMLYRETMAESRADSLAASLEILDILFTHRMFAQVRDYIAFAPELEAERANALVSYAHIKEGNYHLANYTAREYPASYTAKAYSQMYMGRYDEAVQSFKYSSAPFEAEAIGLFQVKKAKEPWLAGALAVIPGMGYAYNGMYQTAASAFVLNIAILATVYELSANDLPIAAISLGLAGSSFYFGSIWGSVNAAHKINQQHGNRNLDLFIDSHIRELLKYTPD